MLVFDGDYLMAHGALDFTRDLTLPIDQVRAVPVDLSSGKWRDAEAMASLTEMRRGLVAAALVK